MNSFFAAALFLLCSQSLYAKPTMHIVAIGINQFKDPLWKSLKYAESDAKQFAEALSQSSPYNVRTKIFRGDETSKNSIVKYFRYLKKRVDRHDIVLVYLSGHGSLYKGASGDLEKVFILPSTQKATLAKTGLRHRDLILDVQSLKAKRTAIIFATCYSGIGKSVLTPQIAQLLAQNKGEFDLAPIEKVSEGFVMLSAASKYEAARESSKLKSDIYTHYLLEALDLYDRNRDGVVSLLEAHDYAKQKTYQYTSGRQRPSMVVEAVGEADFTLRGEREKNAEVAVLEAYDQEFKGLTLEVGDGEKGILPMAFPIQNGQVVHLYSEDQKKIVSYKISAGKGEVLSLKELAKPDPYAFSGYYVQREFSDRRFAKLSGQNSWTTERIEARYFGNHVLVGLFYDGQISQEATLGVGLSSTYELSSYGLYMGSRFYLDPHWYVGGSFRMNQVTTLMTVKDHQTGREKEIDFRKWIPGLQAHAGYSFLTKGLHVNLSYEQYQKQKFTYSELGSLNSETSIWSLGLEVSFGGKGKRL